MTVPFQDRSEAGRQLAKALAAYAHREDVIVLAVPRGGVPVGFEVAQALGTLLDLMLVRKLDTPDQEHERMGAIASGGVSVLDMDVVASRWIEDEMIEGVVLAELADLEKYERLYRGNRPEPDLRDRCVIVVDDGTVSGKTLCAGLEALRQRMPAAIIAALPTAHPDTIPLLRETADEVVCLATPELFVSVNHWYGDFSVPSDAEIRALLAWAWEHHCREAPVVRGKRAENSDRL